MLTRLVITIWGAWLGALGLAATLIVSRILNPPWIVPVGLSLLMLGAGCGLVIGSIVRLIRGPRRKRALAGLLMGTAPFWFLAGHVLLALRPAFDRHVPPGWPSKVFLPLARPLADLEARWLYPERTRGKWVTMVGAKSGAAQSQVAAMDRHVDASLARLNQSKTWPIVWYRGSLFGLSRLAIYDMALGTEVSQDPRDADSLSEPDRHEVAHCVFLQNFTIQSDPPTVLIEGWAEANQGTSAEELASIAWHDREAGRSLSLRELVASDWYWYAGQTAYSQGGPLVNYLLRIYGPERFLKLYTTCQQATFEADCRATLGIGLDQLDIDFWADTEQLARRAGPLSRIWLKKLRLDSSVDRAAWEAFVADYFDAAERLLARYEQSRVTAVFRSRSEGWEHVTRQELLRSGRFARLRKTDEGGYDLKCLATPACSIQARRSIGSPASPWTVNEAPHPSHEQDYRRTLEAIDNEANMLGAPAFQDGLILLRFLQDRKDGGFSADYEVVKFQTKLHEGHRLVTLQLRTGPEVKGRDRDDCTFVFDADDLFVVRSVHGESFETEFEYEHEGGRPIFRALTARSTTLDPTTPKWSSRLEVTECRFGPIPDSEFDPESFLGHLKLDGFVRKSVEAPSTATSFDHYWLAFVGGGISLAGGAGLALGSDRDDESST